MQTTTLYLIFQVDKYFNQVKMDELEEDIANKQNESLAAFDKMDLAKAYDKLFEILWYSQVNLHYITNTIMTSNDHLIFILS